MELEAVHSLTRTQKQTNIRINPSSPVHEARLKRFIRQKTMTPPKSQAEQAPQTPVAAEQPSIDLPPIQTIPTTTSPVVNNRRKRSSSQGNDARPAPAPAQTANKTATADPERTPNPPRARVELAPIAAQGKSHSRSHSREGYSTQLKNSIRTVELKHTQQEQAQARNKEEPAKMELSKIFRIDKKRNKEITIMSQSAVVDKKQEEVVGPVLPTVKLGIKPKDLVFGPDVRKEIMMKNYNSIVDGVRYSMHQVKPLPIFQIRSLQVTLKKKREEMQKTLVLDLDETLIYASKEEPDSKKNLSCIDGGDNCYFGIEIRPYAQEFLQQMSREFEIIVFTAAEKLYAKNVLKLLDPERKYISHLLHRNHCLRTKRGVFIKDLRILLGRELKDIVIVDNFTPSFSFQLTNGIPIITWNGDPKDQELKYLMPYLLEAKKYDDMRKYNKEKLRLEELGEL